MREVKAVVILEKKYKHIDQGDVLLKALRPDNRRLPPGTMIRCLLRGKSLMCRIEATNVDTLRNTLNDILRCLDPTEKTLISLEEVRKNNNTSEKVN